MGTVLIADDDVNIRNVIAAFLEKQLFHTLTFSTGDELLEFYREKVDETMDIMCIILDIMMPGRNGYEICQAIRTFSTIPIIMVSAKNSDFDKIKGLRLGSDDYMVKPFSPLELVARVESLIRRYVQQSESRMLFTINTTFQCGNVHIDDNKKEATCNEKELDLTQTEFALLSYLFQNHVKAVSREELLKNIWNIEVSINTRVIDDTLKRLRKKLSMAKATVTIETVWGYGFMIHVEKE